MKTVTKCPACNAVSDTPFNICPVCNKQIKSNTAKIIFLSTLGVLVVLILTYLEQAADITPVATTPVAITPAQQAAIEGRQNEFAVAEAPNAIKTLEMVRKCPIIVENFSALTEKLKTKGTPVKGARWEIGTDGINDYEVYLYYQCNGRKIDAHWQANLKTKSIKAMNNEAFILSGKREVFFVK